jgi:riboflavin biosynthesis pyrimidine reductase
MGRKFDRLFRDKAHLAEILSGRASNAYKDFLRRKGVSYIVAGGDLLDLEQATRKAGELFGVEEIMLGGGGSLN